MKKIVLSLIIFPIIGFIFLINNNEVQSKSLSLSHTYLAKTSWEPEEGGHGLYLRFNNTKMTYTKSMQGPGGMDCTAPYELKNGQILLKNPVKKDQYNNGSVSCVASRCKLIYDSKSFYKSLKLVCGSDSFWDSKKIVQPGKRRYVGNIPVITMGLKDGILKYNMKMRTGPSTKYKVNKCRIGLYETAKKKGYLKKGYKVTILGRTLKKARVGRYTGYWYYVDLNVTDPQYMSCDKNKTWFFGSFVTVK